MKHFLFTIIAFAVVSTISCGGGGGRNIVLPPGDSSSDYPNMSGSYQFTWTVQADPNQVVGRILNPPEILTILLSTSGSTLSGIDSDGRQWLGQFTSTSGALTIVCTQSGTGMVVRSTATGTYNKSSDSASGTYVQVLISGFGEENGATVSGSWVAVQE